MRGQGTGQQMQDRIIAEGLVKQFDDFIAVDKVDLHVGSGEVLVLLGPNGAGKTTTVRMLTSILIPTKGSAWVNGYHVVKEADKVRQSVGVLTEHHGLYGRMNAEEYLTFFGRLYNLDLATIKLRIYPLLERFDLAGARKKRLGEYSKGMRQKLALVRALLHDPPVLLLDEPTSAMDPESSRVVREAITNLRSADRTIVLCTHNLSEAELLADQMAIIRRGKIILSGQIDDLKKQLLGPPEYEVRLAQEIDEPLPDFPAGVELLDVGMDSLRFRIQEPRIANPRLLRQLLEKKMEVITFQETPRSLEQVYIQAVRDADGEQTDG